MCSLSFQFKTNTHTQKNSCETSVLDTKKRGRGYKGNAHFSSSLFEQGPSESIRERASECLHHRNWFDFLEFWALAPFFETVQKQCLKKNQNLILIWTNDDDDLIM